jgi:hypothetical protein
MGDVNTYPFGSPVTLQYDFLDEDGGHADPPLNASTEVFYKDGDGTVHDVDITTMTHVDTGIFTLRVHGNVVGRWWYGGRSADGSAGADERYFEIAKTQFPDE